MFEFLSIIVTGRNDADTLEPLLRRLRQIEITHEVLYFDLGSTDDSLKRARRYATRCFRITDMTWRRSSGRWSGSVVAEFDWLLFLDGDMMIQDEFIDYLNHKTYMRSRPSVGGFVGSYHRMVDGRRDSTNLLPNRAGNMAARFEGALLVRRELLIRAGNWMPSLSAHSPVDLRVRLLSRQTEIEALPIPMVVKRKPQRSEVLRLAEEFLPLNRNFFGYGQLVVSQIRHRSFLRFLSLHPCPWIVGAGLAVGVVGGQAWGGMIAAAALGVLAVRKGFREVLDCVSALIRMPFGMVLYNEKKPRYEEAE